MSAPNIGLAVLISGGGSNLQALIDACEKSDFPAHIAVVISNRPGVKGLERAEKAGIHAVTIDHKNFPDRAAFENALQDELYQHEIDLICLAGFMRILTPGFVGKWENKIINTHPALLPKFGGEGMYGEHVHKAVLEAKEKESGASIHYVIPEVDQGEVIVQKAVPVMPDDTHETLAARVLAQEHQIYPEAVRIIAEKH